MCGLSGRRRDQGALQPTERVSSKSPVLTEGHLPLRDRVPRQPRPKCFGATYREEAAFPVDEDGGVGGDLYLVRAIRSPVRVRMRNAPSLWVLKSLDPGLRPGSGRPAEHDLTRLGRQWVPSTDGGDRGAIGGESSRPESQPRTVLSRVDDLTYNTGVRILVKTAP